MVALSIIYEVNQAYGYSLRPNQVKKRFDNKFVRINEAGLREVGKWEDCVAKKGMDWCIDSGYFD